MGTPDFSLPALKKLIAGEHEVVAVYTKPDTPSGRGRNLAISSAKQVALEVGLPVLQPKTLKSESEAEQLIALKPDLIVVVAYGQMLPQRVLDIPKFGCLNIHPSLLPKYRGPSPVASAILSGDEETGVTIMLLDAGMDSGPIVSQMRVPIESGDTTASLDRKLAELGADFLADTLPRWFDGQLKPQPQDESLATYTKTISKADGLIDWTLSATEIWRRMKAFDPWPGCYTAWGSKTIKILDAIPLPARPEDNGGVEPGEVVEIPFLKDVPIGIVAGEEILGILALQMEGRKAVSAPEFLRGQRNFIGQKLG